MRVDSAAGDAGETTRFVAVLGLSRKVRVSGSVDERITAISACQRGRLARWQLLDAGLGPDQIDRRLHTGRLVRRHAGVYSDGAAVPAALTAETEALLACRAGAMLSHSSAARVWGMIDRPAHDGEPVHVLVPGTSAGRRRGIRVHRSRTLEPADRRLHLQLPVCAPARVLLDLAIGDPGRPLARALDQARIARLLTDRELRELLARAGRHPGHAALVALLAAEAEPALTRSEAEELLLTLLAETDLPRPLVNQRLHGYEVDFLWPQARFIVEVDGYRFHSSRSAFESNRARDQRLQAHGYEVMRVTWRQLVEDRVAVAVRIGAALQRRDR